MAINRNKGKLTRFFALKGIVAGLFTIILLRLTYLQVFKYEDFREKADTRSRRFVAEKAPRGKIYDANGNVLATNQQTYIATFTETDTSKNNFYKSMETFFGIMESNEQEIVDNFDIVIENNEIKFDFGFENPENKKAAEIRFKTDKGIFDEIKNDEYPKQNNDLSDEQIQNVENKILGVSADDVFYYLVYKYDMYELLNEYKDRNPNLSTDELKELKNSIKNRYKTEEIKTFAQKIEYGKKVTQDILKEKTLDEIKRFMVVKDVVKMNSFSGFKPVTIAPKIDQDTAFTLYQKLNSLPGVEINLEPVRYYPYGELGANFLGYMGAIPSSSKEKYESRGYDLSTDLIGMSGVESAYENVLKGTKGGEVIKVNAEGRSRESLYSMQTTPGNNIHLTIDKDIQYSAEKMLANQLKYIQSSYDGKNATRGAAVAINVKTGDVLAMASYPTYNPNIFASGEISDDVAKGLIAPNLETFGAEYIRKSGLNKTVDDLFPKDSNGVRQDPHDIYPKPMFNYATMGLIPPGSTFKPITALMALEEGVATATTAISDSAVLGSGLRFIKYKDLIDTPKDNAHHGNYITVKEAIQKSCNSYFYEVAVNLYRKYNSSIEGLNSISNFTTELGLSPEKDNENQISGTGIEIAERVGSVYSFDGSKEKFKVFSMWDLVAGLEKGRLNGSGQSFTPVDIEKDDADSKELEKAKEELKTIVKTEIDKIESLAATGDEEEFKLKVQKALENIYNVSEVYKESIAKKKSNIKIQFEIISTEIWNWIQYNVKYQIVNPGNLASASIGQGDTNLTPLQITSAIGAMLNDGTRYKVNIVDKITTPTGELVSETEPTVVGQLEFNENNLKLVKDGMYMTNHATGGTAYNIFNKFPIKTGGKTGTATLKANQNEVGRTDYGVYIAAAPIDDPEIAVCIVGYDGLSGGRMSIVARAIFETYFREEIKEIAPNYAPVDSYGKAYEYTLTPESMDFKDDGIFYQENLEKKIKEEN